jgi:hypothetical protein
MAAVLRGCVAGYRQANPGREIRLDEPGVRSSCSARRT